MAWATPIIHATGDVLTASDWNISSNDLTFLASGIVLATKTYAPNSQTTYAVSATTATTLDATNLAVTFTVPPSGNVLVHGEIFAQAQVLQVINMGWSESGSLVGLPCTVLDGGSSGPSLSQRVAWTTKITGLTPGASHTYAMYTECGLSANFYAGGPGTIGTFSNNAGPALLEVRATA